MSKLLAMTCAVAMSAALAASGVAAQTSIDGFQIAPEDVPRARSYCNSLAAQSNRSLTDEGEKPEEPSPDPASSFSQGANSMDNALSGFDLNRLTLARCRALGL